MIVAASKSMSPPDSPGEVPTSIRRRVEGSAELLYADIEDALRQALRSASKERHVRWPECSKGFKVKVPDYAASVTAAKALLEIAVGRPKPREVEHVDILDDLATVDVKKLSTAELRALVRSTRQAAREEQADE
jgi:hypothetical protein